MSKVENAIIVFIKNPALGKVKTRLAETVGDEQALKIYKSLMDHTRTVVSGIPAKRLLFYSQWINQSDDWLAQDFDKHLQADGNLGDRITTAFETGCSQAQKVIIVGSDCPGLSQDIITEAYSSLDTNDFVIGPALDGGYYLLGMKAYSPEIFQNIHWSSATVKAETLAIIQSLGKTVAELTPLSDIDYAEDWEKYGWEVN